MNMRPNIGSLGAFKLRWLDVVYRACDGRHMDFYVAYALFEAYATGIDLNFEVAVVEMAATAGLTRRALQVTMRRFERYGVMTRTIRYGRGATNTYSFVIPQKHCAEAA